MKSQPQMEKPMTMSSGVLDEEVLGIRMPGVARIARLIVVGTLWSANASLEQRKLT